MITLAAWLVLPTGASAVTQTFNFTGSAQAFTVPTGVTQITVEALGAAGGASQSGAAGGRGGSAIATIAVTPGEVLQVNVGGRGGTGNPAAGGFNGGGAGGATSGGGGGGASDVRRGGTGLAARIVIAGGGGGGGTAQSACTGGSGGGAAGDAGSSCTTAEGRGGTQVAGGAAGAGTGTPGDGGAGVGGVGGDGSSVDDDGGGGGGGLFGGGGGGGGYGGGGGGGSGFTPDGTGMRNGVRAGDGQVTMTYTVTPTLTTNASGNVTPGEGVHDTATLADGASPTGQITFALYGPDDGDCSGAPVFTDAKTVSGNGAYRSESFAPTAAGTYRWIATYSGDADNNAVAGACNDPNESVTVEVPVFRKTLVAGLVEGTVLIRERGSRAFRPLTGSELIPRRSSVDATNGRVRITAATKGGGTQKTEFYEGRFEVDQVGGGLVTAKLEGVNFGSCKNRSQTATRAPKKLARLWGSGRGKARTKGRRGSGTVRGTVWLTEESCRGTLFKVKEGVLKVRDFARRKKVTLRAGDRYLARGR